MENSEQGTPTKNGSSVVQRVSQGDSDEVPNPSSTSTPRKSHLPNQPVSASPKKTRVLAINEHFREDQGSPINKQNVVQLQSPAKVGTKRKSSTPAKNDSKRRNTNEDDAVVSENEDEVDKLEESVDPFSIHRLNMEKLRFQSTYPNSVVKMIEELMGNVNAKYGTKSSKSFENLTPETQEKTNTTNENLQPPADTLNNFNFQVLTFVQTIKQDDKFLRQLGIKKRVQKLNKIVFYARPNEIFVIATGQCWKIIQPHCCYEFPHIVAGRIASQDGSIQETVKPFTGNVTMQRTTSKNATTFDQLNNIRFHSTKEIRPDASIFWLKEFKPEKSGSSSLGRRIKLILGMAYLRIQKSMKLTNIPELLDYFSKICNNEKTLSFPKENPEKHVVDLQLIRTASSVLFKDCEEHMIDIIYSFVHNERQETLKEFGLCDKYVEDFCTATDFILKCDSTEIKSFSSVPLALDIFRALKQTCEYLTGAKDLKVFQARFQHVRIEFVVNGGYSITRKLTDLLEWELNLRGGVYLKMIGNWFEVREGYHFKLQMDFNELLNKDLILAEGDPGYLKNKWNSNTMRSLGMYIQSYENEENILIPTGSLEEEDKEGKDPYIFDLMQLKGVGSEGDEQYQIFIYQIFPNFDSKIRGASIRLQMFLESLKHGERKPIDSENGEETLSKPPFQMNSSQNSQEKFKQLFPTFETFLKTLMDAESVTVVAAFRTSVESVGVENPPNSSRIARSLQQECNLKLHLNTEIIQNLIVNQLSQQTVDTICKELGIPPERVSSTILDKLSENRWCNQPESVESLDKPVSDKLLTLRSSESFKLFKDDKVNNEIFELLRPHFITQFPGIIHKLEVIKMHDCTVAHPLPRLNFKIMEILDEN